MLSAGTALATAFGVYLLTAPVAIFKHPLTYAGDFPSCVGLPNCKLAVFATANAVVAYLPDGGTATIQNSTANGFEDGPMTSGGGSAVKVAKDITDGTAPYILAADAQTILGTPFWSSDHTVMCAAMPTALSSANPVIVSHGLASTDGVFMQVISGSNVLRCSYNSSGATQNAQQAYTSPLSKWSIWSCSKATTNYVARVAGVETPSVVVTAATNPADKNLYFGRYNSTANAMRGPLYGCMFFDAALSSSTKALYEAQLLKGLAVRPADTYVTTVRASAASDHYPSGVVAWSGDNVRIPHGTKGLQSFSAVTNSLLHRRLFSVGAWVASNVTFAATTGIDGVASSATRIAATAGNGTALQALVLASATRIFAIDVKRVVGTGQIDITRNNGTNWAPLSSSNCFDVDTMSVGTAPNSSTWVRCYLSTTLANPTVGIRLVTSGNSIDVDYAQDEAGAVAMPRCDHPTQTAAAVCAADVHTLPTTGWPTTSGEISIVYTANSSSAPAAQVVILDTRNGASANGVVIYRAAANTLNAILYDATGNVCQMSAAATWTAAKTIELQWTATTCALLDNGAVVDSDVMVRPLTAHATTAKIGSNLSGAEQSNGWHKALCAARTGGCPQ